MNTMTRLLGLCLLSAAACFSGVAIAAPETIAIIGTGRVGSALGPQFARLGHAVIYGSRDPARPELRELVAKTGPGAKVATQQEAAKAAQIVVLATPWQATEAVVKSLDLAGRIVIDVTNPMKLGPDGLMEIVVEGSGGELVQSWAPKSRVVKAFNTVGSHVMANPRVVSGPVTVLIASDDAAAKARVAALVRDLGLEPLDAGPLKYSRYLEGMSVLYLYPYLTGRREQAFEYYLRQGSARKDSKDARPAE